MWWMLPCTAFAGAPAEDLMTRLDALGPNVVVGLSAADASVVADLRRLDEADSRVALTLMVLGGTDDPATVLTRAAASIGGTCGAFATRGATAWTVTPYGTCASAAAPVPPTPVVTAPTGDPLIDLVAKLVSMKDWAARRAALTAQMATNTDADALGRLAAAIAVSNSLEAAGRYDPSIVRMFLQAALSADSHVRQAAMDAARTNGDPPTAPATHVTPDSATTAPAEDAVASEPPHVVDPAVLRDYARRRFVRDSLTLVSGGQYYVGSHTTWSVYDGKGAPIPALAFARAAGDKATLARMAHQAKVGRNVAIVGSVVGTVGLGLTVVGLNMVDPVRDMQTDAGIGVTATGVGMIFGYTLFPLALFPAWQRTTTAAHFYSTSRADTYIDAYNAHLRAELGLTEADVQSIEISR